MATITHKDESLGAIDEFFYLNSNMIDTEPLYRNFTVIQNALRQPDEQKQLNTPIHSINDSYRATRVQIEPSSPELPNINHPKSSKPIDGYIFNLIQIVEDIGYNPQSPFLQSPDNNNHNELSYIISKLGGVHGSLAKIRRLHYDTHYFQRWYLDKYQRSASITQINHVKKQTTQKLDIVISPSISTNFLSKQMDDEEKHFQNQIHRIYGFDDTETMSSKSSRRSSIDDLTKPRPQITIREYYPSKEITSVTANRSPSTSSGQFINTNEYEQLLSSHPELNNDLNPEIIRKPNPDQVTYKQNISIRYLVPPTPPPPGPLIIREILPPRQPTPPPLVIKHQDPTPPTPPPLIIREAPPPPPPHQEAQVITKVLSQESASQQRVVVEHNPPLPPKPQSIIIEKWLPYKPAPPREIIYERVIENPTTSEFQPGSITTDRQRRHSAEFSSNTSSRLHIPVHIERQNSLDHLGHNQSSVFNQFASSTQQQINAIQHQTLEKIKAHQQWIANQHQRNMNMIMQIPSQLTTPTLVVNHPPVTRTVTSYVQRAAVHQPPFIFPFHT